MTFKPELGKILDPIDHHSTYVCRFEWRKKLSPTSVPLHISIGKTFLLIPVEYFKIYDKWHIFPPIKKDHTRPGNHYKLRGKLFAITKQSHIKRYCSDSRTLETRHCLKTQNPPTCAYKNARIFHGPAALVFRFHYIL